MLRSRHGPQPSFLSFPLPFHPLPPLSSFHGCERATFSPRMIHPAFHHRPREKASRAFFNSPRNFTIGIFPTRNGAPHPVPRAREKHLYINLKIMTYVPCLRASCASRITPSESSIGGICLPTRNGEITAGRPLGLNATANARTNERMHACIRDCKS